MLTRFGWVVTMTAPPPLAASLPQPERLASLASAEVDWFMRMLRVGTDAAGNLRPPPQPERDGDGPLLAAYGCNALVHKMGEAYAGFLRRVWAPRMLLLLRGAWRAKRDGGAEFVAFKASDCGKTIEIRGDVRARRRSARALP